MGISNYRFYKIALECIAEELKRVAVAANLYEMYGLDSPSSINAFRKRADLRAARDFFQEKAAEVRPKLLKVK